MSSQAYVGMGLKKFTARTLRAAVRRQSRTEYDVDAWAPILKEKLAKARGVKRVPGTFDALDALRAYQAAVRSGNQVPCQTGFLTVFTQMISPQVASAIWRNLTGERKQYSRARDLKADLHRLMNGDVRTSKVDNRHHAANKIAKVLERARV